jgi:hypothetical protein
MFSWNGGDCVCNFWNASNGRFPALDDGRTTETFIVKNATGRR